MEKGNSCKGTEELRSAVLVYVIDAGQKGRTLEEICTNLTLEEEEAKNILSGLESSRLIRSSVTNDTERWFSLAEVA